jgi:hypothetical protein
MTERMVSVPAELIERVREEFRLIRSKDTNAVYDTTLRVDLSLALTAAPAQPVAGEVESLGGALIALVEHFERVDACAEDKAAIKAACDVWAEAKATEALRSIPAPVREEGGAVTKACADFQEAIDYFEADVADALAEGSERADLWDREVTVNIDALKTVMNAALATREEAPACKKCGGKGYTEYEGGEGEGYPSRPEVETCSCRKEAPAEAGERDYPAEFETWWATYRHRNRDMADYPVKKQIAFDAFYFGALRARSSAPEALGNLLAVIHGDGGHRALEVGTKQAALEAEKIVAGLFAAPSADKLRIAVEALERARTNIEGWAEAAGENGRPSVRDADLAEIDQALAALKAEGA